MNLQNLRISFEIECFVNGQGDMYKLLAAIDRPDLFGAGVVELFNEVPKSLIEKIEYVTGYKGWTNDEFEGSVKINENEEYDDFLSFELVPPVLPFESGVSCLRAALAFLKEAGIRTNETCGLHVNISYDGIVDISPFTLIKLLPEVQILEMFGRRHNSFCIPFADRKAGLSEETMAMFIENSDNFSKKNSSVNFDKLKLGYLEFRMLGGDCLNNVDNVFSAIDIIVESLYKEYNFVYI